MIDWKKAWNINLELLSEKALKSLEFFRSSGAGTLHDTPPHPLSGWDQEHPLSVPFPVGVFSVSVSVPLVTQLRDSGFYCPNVGLCENATSASRLYVKKG